MAESSVSVHPWEDLEQIIRSGNGEALATFLTLLPPEDTAYTIAQLQRDDQTKMLAMLSQARPEFAADLMEHFADEHAATMIEELEHQAAAAIVEEMDSDEQADVLSELDDEDAQAILERMAPEEAEDARDRLRYPEDTAGGLMITELLIYPQHADVDDVIHDLREHADRYHEYETRTLYVVNDDQVFVGEIQMRSLVVAPRGTLLTQLLVPEPFAVRVDAHLDELETIFDRIDDSSVPVLDENDRLCGIVQRASVQEALSERSGEALMKVGGIIRGEELRSMSVTSRTLRRMTFLMPILFLLIVSASIIGLFEATVEAVPIIAAFLPVVAGLCGSGGTQSLAVSMREISLGLIKPADFLRVVGKEATVALINGVVLGIVLILIAWIWQGNLALAVAIGGAVPVALVVATCVGGGVPLLLRAVNVDPAMASGPIVTTVVDLVAFSAVLLLTTLLLVQVTGP